MSHICGNAHRSCPCRPCLWWAAAAMSWTRKWSRKCWLPCRTHPFGGSTPVTTSRARGRRSLLRHSATSLSGRDFLRRDNRMALHQAELGRVFEDFVVGDGYQHALGRTISEADCTWFPLLTCNTNQNHFNAHLARTNP